MDKYILTGVTGHLGGVVARLLLEQGKPVVGLYLPGEENSFPAIRSVYGNVRDKESLRGLFGSEGEAIVIHCAGHISISSFDGPDMWETNVLGTRNIVDLALEYGVKKFVYVSSVHAIPELPMGQTISEVSNFSADNVEGNYAKTKASATAYVMEAMKKGLPACIVHPSGIIGPYDPGQGQMTTVLQMFLTGKLPMGVQGGYDFVDVRDAAQGILAACDKGHSGECYILSGHYYTVREFLSLASKTASKAPPRLYASAGLLRPPAVLWERLLHRLGRRTVFTPYSLYTLGTNADFSHKKATFELGYTVRSREETVSDMVCWTIAGLQKNSSF